MRKIKESNVYRVEGSFAFTAQIPDDSVGCSGSRCANCDTEVPYCNQICRYCGLPFVGPGGFPQYPTWTTLSTNEKMTLFISAFNSYRRGRLGYANVAFVPLTSDELTEVEELEGREANLFELTHKISPKKIREVLLLPI